MYKFQKSSYACIKLVNNEKIHTFKIGYKLNKIINLLHFQMQNRFLKFIPCYPPIVCNQYSCETLL